MNLPCDIGASELQLGDSYMEPGDVDVTTITELDTHGDYVLITGVNDGCNHATVLDRDTVVQLITRTV